MGYNQQGDPRSFSNVDVSPDYSDQEESGEYDNQRQESAENHLRRQYQQRSPQRRSDVDGHGVVNEGYQYYSDVDDNDNNVDSYNQQQPPSNGSLGDSADGNVREVLEMQRMAAERRSGGGRYYKHRTSDSDGLNESSSGLRRAKSLHQNGYDYYRNLRARQHSTEEPYPDYHGRDLEPDKILTKEDIARTRKFLATLRIKRKTRKRSSRRRDEEGGGDGLGTSGRSLEDGGERGLQLDLEDGESVTEDEEEEEEVGLPSARPKMKGLAERMKMAKMESAVEVKRQLQKKDSIWEVKYRTVSFKKKQKSSFNRASKSVHDWASSLSYNINFWSGQFKEIEGQCGVATTTYFRFSRWLVKINFLVFIIFFSFLYVPQFITWAENSKDIFLRDTPLVIDSNHSGLNQAVACSDAYIKHVDNITDSAWIPVILDIVTGQGLLEDTSIFYGRYSNLSLTFNSSRTLGTDSYSIKTDFNMSLVYILVMMFSFLIVFIMILRKSSQSVRETILDLEDSSHPFYTNAVFAGWDYCIHLDKMVTYKQKMIYNNFQGKLEEIEIKNKQKNQTHQERIVLYFKRILINFLVLCILGGCFTAIIFTTNFLLEQQEKDNGEVLTLVYEFLPSLVITALNFSIPTLFMYLVSKEEYSPQVSTSLTIIRAVFLRISLVGVLLFSIYNRLFHKKDRDPYSCPEEGLTQLTTRCCGNPLWKTNTFVDGEEKGSVKCWETYVGQQFYKLAIADFFNVTFVYFAACTVRKLVWSKLKTRLRIVDILGLAPFDLPVEVLDIVYIQTVCWVGMFFAPLLPTLCLMQTFIYFFVKKYILLHLCEAPKNTHRASRSYSFFQVVLLITFTIICVLIGYMIRNIQPSKSCGPFRVYAMPDHVMFDAITHEINTWADVPKGIFNFFGTVTFFIPAFSLLIICIYYYWTVASGYKRLEKLLHQELKSESTDKQFLFGRVDEFIKQGLISLHDKVL